MADFGWLARPPYRVFSFIGLTAALVMAGYWAWTPGMEVTDGRHDLRANGIWIGHGWLGADEWFQRNKKDPAKFRSEAAIRALEARLTGHGIKSVFPHLSPCAFNGRIPPVDGAQVELFIKNMPGKIIIPWTGGVLGEHAFPGQAKWREGFIASLAELLRDHPGLGGIHINIEPMPSGNRDFITFLREVKASLPEGKILSVAAYPPPTMWHPVKDVHWDESYYREVAANADQMAVMMYDTALRFGKIYRSLMADWTRQTLAWSGGKQTLLGVPAYDDAGAGYHHPEVENLENALAGIHAGLGGSGAPPAAYGGVAIYSEWEMDEAEWGLLKRSFNRAEPLGKP